MMGVQTWWPSRSHTSMPGTADRPPRRHSRAGSGSPPDHETAHRASSTRSTAGSRALTRRPSTRRPAPQARPDHLIGNSIRPGVLGRVRPAPQPSGVFGRQALISSVAESFVRLLGSLVSKAGSERPQAGHRQCGFVGRPADGPADLPPPVRTAAPVLSVCCPALCGAGQCHCAQARPGSCPPDSAAAAARCDSFISRAHNHS